MYFLTEKSRTFRDLQQVKHKKRQEPEYCIINHDENILLIEKMLVFNHIDK